jgi:peptide/nickel transport system ATP-binding protein
MLALEDVQVLLDADAGLVRALDGVSLTLQRGETYALVGESGCGKSMTALALMRLLPENGGMGRGRIMLDGDANLLALPEFEMRRIRGGRVGIIFQEPATSLNPVMRVGDQIVESIEAHTALRGEAARAKAIEWLQRVGIPEPQQRIDSYPFEMSGGQKQRVMIAMTLAAEPDYLIADEPTTALDVTIQKQVLDLLRDLQRERQVGLLLITHDLAVVASMAQRVALMYAGQIVEEAPAEAFFRQPQHPYARLLLQALPDADRRGQPLVAIGGTVPPLWQRFEGCRFAPRCDRVQSRCQTEAPVLEGQAYKVRCWFSLANEATLPLVQPLAHMKAVTGSPERTTHSQARPIRQRCSPSKACPCSSVLAAVFSSPGVCLMPCVMSASICMQARPSPWSANPVAARPPRAAPSCSCCAPSPRSRCRAKPCGKGLQVQGKTFSACRAMP